MRREYKGAAPASVLTALLGSSTNDLTIQCNDLTNWPTGANSRPFFVVIDRGKANEEKILCSSRSGNIISVYSDGLTSGRAFDGTSASSHSINAVIEHVFTALDADEANAHVNASAAIHGVQTVVGTTETQTLTNKTMSGANNTFVGIARSSISGLVEPYEKGQLAVGTAGSVTLLSVGSAANMTLLVDDTQPTGMKWGRPAMFRVGAGNFTNVATVDIPNVFTDSSVSFHRLILRVGDTGTAGSYIAMNGIKEDNTIYNVASHNSYFAYINLSAATNDSYVNQTAFRVIRSIQNDSMTLIMDFDNWSSSGTLRRAFGTFTGFAQAQYESISVKTSTAFPKFTGLRLSAFLTAGGASTMTGRFEMYAY